MAPRNPLPVCDDSPYDDVEPVMDENTHGQKRPPMQIKWLNVTWMTGLHLLALYGVFCLPSAHPLTWLWSKYSLFISQRNYRHAA